MKQLSMDQGKVDWFKMVWQKKANPRHAFLLTLALMQKKATTANWIRSWGMPVNDSCVLLRAETKCTFDKIEVWKWNLKFESIRLLNC